MPGAEEDIREALDWCGLSPDESPWKGGPHGPYRQSERRTCTAAYVDQLIEADKAYYAFDTPRNWMPCANAEGSRVAAPGLTTR